MTYGSMPDGRQVRAFDLTNAGGMRVRVLEYGAILDSVEVPDRAGALADVTHGYDTLEGWRTNTAYFGATVGRVGNRIAAGRFALDGKTYALATNNDPGAYPCHLHGGSVGFDKVLWTGEQDGNLVRLRYTSPDGEEGYPGALLVQVTYTLTENEFVWEAKATTDAPTVVNLVHHPYWNLSGVPTSSINDHELILHADHFLPTDPGMIPTGELAPVAGTPMDFTSAVSIGARVEEDFEPLRLGAGYDHAWVLRKPDAQGLRPAASLRDPKTGRTMEIATNQPAIQFYGGNFLDGSIVGKKGVRYARRSALALEPENYPDAPNHPDFPSPVLRPGETYRHVVRYRFSAS